MRLFAYKPDSILGNWFIKGLNKVLLGIMFIGMASNTSNIELKFFEIPAMVVPCQFLSLLIAELITKSQNYSDKAGYISKYSLICNTLLFLLVLLIRVCWGDIHSLFDLAILSVPVSLLIFNICNIPTLFSSFLDDCKY